MLMKKTIKTALLIIGIISCIILTSCIPELPEPEVTYGRFPFKLVYEVDGERITVEDTYIIEYKGWDWSFDEGTYYLWDTSVTRKLPRESVSQYFDRVLIIKKSTPQIEFMIGSARYYFGLEENVGSVYNLEDLEPGDFRISSREYTGYISEEEIYEKYGIKIIEKYVSPPLFERDDSKD